MLKNIDVIKGIHPGFVLERELRKRKIAKGRFALSIGEYPQTLVSITKGKRNMNVALALKIERALNLEEGYFMILQTYFEIDREKRKNTVLKKPDTSKLRKALFWDTQFDKIDWDKQKRSVIKRVFERGNLKEKNEIRKFYGQDVIDNVLKKPHKE